MVEVREYGQADLQAMVDVWNEVVRDGIAFPQEDELDLESGAEFFGSQTHCGVAVEDGRVLGLYILHPNNVGARHLYEKLGFTQLGTIPDGFRMPDGTYADICPYYREL